MRRVELLVQPGVQTLGEATPVGQLSADLLHRRPRRGGIGSMVLGDLAQGSQDSAGVALRKRGQDALGRRQSLARSRSIAVLEMEGCRMQMTHDRIGGATPRGWSIECIDLLGLG